MSHASGFFCPTGASESLDGSARETAAEGGPGSHAGSSRTDTDIYTCHPSHRTRHSVAHCGKLWGRLVSAHCATESELECCTADRNTEKCLSYGMSWVLLCVLLQDLAMYINEVKRDNETLKKIGEFQCSIENLVRICGV